MDERDFELIARLVKNGWVSMDDIEKCRELQKATPSKWLGDLLLEHGYIIREQYETIKDLAAKNKFHIPGYRFTGKIGAGGMAVVFKAVQISIDRPVAVKILPPQKAVDAADTQRFIREVKALGHLNHPNIVSALDAGEINGVFYCVMEYVDGEGLEERIARLGRLPEADALVVVEQIARALDHAWQHGYVHRDIKPSNVLITKDGVVKLTDLGIAKSQAGDDPRLTQTGTTVGSPLYISPEQAKGEEVDIGTDIYSLGVTLFQMVTGRTPFQGTTMEVVAKHVTQPLPSPREFVTTLSEGLCTLIARMTAKDRAQRHKDPAQLLEDLRRVREGRPITSPPAKRTGRIPAASAPRLGHTSLSGKKRGSTVIAWGIGIAAAIGAFLIISIALQQQRTPVPSSVREPAAVNDPGETIKPIDAPMKERETQAIAARFLSTQQRFDALAAAVRAGPEAKDVPDIRTDLRNVEKELSQYSANANSPDAVKEKVLLAKQQLPALDKELDAILQKEVERRRAIDAFADLEKKYPWLHKGDAKLPLPAGMRNTADERKQLESAREIHRQFIKKYGGQDQGIKGRAEKAVAAIETLLKETSAEEQRQTQSVLTIVAEAEALAKGQNYEEALTKCGDAAARYGERAEIRAATSKIKNEGFRYYAGEADKAAREQNLKDAIGNHGRQHRFSSTPEELASTAASLQQIRQRVAADARTRSIDIRKAYTDKRYAAAKKIAADTRANEVYSDYWGVMDAVIDECANAEKAQRTPEELTANAARWNKSIAATQPTFAAILGPILKKCDSCAGVGTTPCASCKNGRVGPCPVCKGNPKTVPCPTCGGRGEVEHDLCKGGKEPRKGAVVDPADGKRKPVEGACDKWFQALYRIRYLPMKEGDIEKVNIEGVVHELNKAQYLAMLQERYGACKNGLVPCKTCGGKKKGECAACGGTGLGECPKCSGTMRLPCAACKGTGFAGN